MKLSRIGAALVAAFLLAPAAAAEPLPVLRGQVTVSGDLVTVGDLFRDAGPVASVAIFRAPDLGRSGTVSVEAVGKAATAAGLEAFDAVGLTAVTVSRPARAIEPEEMIALLRAGLAQKQGVEEAALDLAFDALPVRMQADPKAAMPVSLAALRASPGNPRFEATFAIDQGGTIQRMTVSGAATEMVALATLVRPVARGEVVTVADLAITRLPVQRAVAGAVADPAAITGQAAQRTLRPGVPLLRTDFAPPNLVARGDTVQIVYRTAALTLTARGRALADGRAGDTVSVVNLTSNRILQAVVTDSGTVSVAPVERTGRVSVRVQ